MTRKQQVSKSWKVDLDNMIRMSCFWCFLSSFSHVSRLLGFLIYGPRLAWGRYLFDDSATGLDASGV